MISHIDLIPTSCSSGEFLPAISLLTCFSVQSPRLSLCVTDSEGLNRKRTEQHLRLCLRDREGVCKPKTIKFDGNHLQTVSFSLNSTGSSRIQEEEGTIWFKQISYRT